MKTTLEIREFCRTQADHHKEALSSCRNRDKPVHAGFQRAYLTVINFIDEPHSSGEKAKGNE